MSHYAEIKNGIVQRVIIAEQDFINTIPGQWVETTPGAMGGIHYDNYGIKTDKHVLRKNYAYTHFTYNQELDAFIPPKTSKLTILDEDTCCWKQCIESEYTNDFVQQFKNTPIFYVDQNDFNQINTQTWSNLEHYVGVKFTNDINELSTNTLSLSDKSTALLVTEYEHRSPFSLQTFCNITDRVLMQELDIPTIKTILPLSPNDLSVFEDKPLFIKRRTTHGKDAHKLSYSKWESKDDFLMAVSDGAFWDEQSQDNNAFIVQQLLPHPLISLNIHIAVNDNGEILVLMKMLRTHLTARTHSSYIPYDDDCDELLNKIEKICKIQKIKASCHELEFVYINGEWTLMDWNARLTGPNIQCLANFYPVLNNAFLHMTGSSQYIDYKMPYVEQHCYKVSDMPTNLIDLGYQFGILPVQDDGMIKFTSADKSKEVVKQRFAAFIDVVVRTIKH